MHKEWALWPQKHRDGVALAQTFYQERGANLPKHVKKIAFVGMGGSGVAGRISKALLDRRPSVETCIIDSPLIPAHIGTDTLAVVISYSGNTWETLDVLATLTEKFIPTIVIGHGGRAIEIAEQKGLPFVLVPESMTPRTALGVFLGFLATLLEKMGILSGSDKASAWLKDAEKYIPAMLETHFYKDFLSIVNGYDIFHVWGVGGDSD